MKITVRGSATTVCSTAETPHRRLWNLGPGLVVPQFHTPSVYFRREDAADATSLSGMQVGHIGST
jgi:hypothetical protein